MHASLCIIGTAMKKYHGIPKTHCHQLQRSKAENALGNNHSRISFVFQDYSPSHPGSTSAKSQQSTGKHHNFCLLSEGGNRKQESSEEIRRVVRVHFQTFKKLYPKISTSRDGLREALRYSSFICLFVCDRDVRS